jgi:hypothetical protein
MGITKVSLIKLGKSQGWPLFGVLFNTQFDYQPTQVDKRRKLEV